MRNALRVWPVILLIVLVACSPASLLPRHQSRPTPSPTPSPMPTEPATFDINGSITVSDYDLLGDPDYDGELCVSSEGYDDISDGAQVTVADESGKILAVGDLGSGRTDGAACEFLFKLADVPETASLYSIRVGREARGALTYSKEKLDEMNDYVELSLG